MKKIVLFLLTVMMLRMSGCGSGDSATWVETTNTPKQEVVEIRERFFIEQCLDINYNPENYRGKLVSLEGMYTSWPYHDDTVHVIYRLTQADDCCPGGGDPVGFEFRYSGDTVLSDNDWIRVTGNIDIHLEDGNEYVVLNLTELEVMNERGAEIVHN